MINPKNILNSPPNKWNLDIFDPLSTFFEDIFQNRRLSSKKNPKIYFFKNSKPQKRHKNPYLKKIRELKLHDKFKGVGYTRK